jgi:hypothetical protein
MSVLLLIEWTVYSQHYTKSWQILQLKVDGAALGIYATKMQSDILGKFGLSKDGIKASLENLLS